MRIFLDTNVLISTYLVPDGTCSVVTRQVRENHTPIIDTIVVNEIERVLRDKLEASHTERALSLQFLDAFTVVSNDGEQYAVDSSLQADRYILASAVAADADVLITGDNAFRAIDDEVPELSIRTPREFLDAEIDG
jgi:putative PIN family toxin of toxin-antitoxin system